MRLRRRCLLAGMVGLLLALPWLLWGGYALVALLRGEHFYHGLPTSYWRRQLAGPGNEWRHRRLTKAEAFPVVGTVLVCLNAGWKPMLTDPGALPVLADLMQDENPIVRHATILELADLPGEESDFLLKGALTDPSIFVQRQAATHLYARTNDAARADDR
jgi:hypothetical protein